MQADHFDVQIGSSNGETLPPVSSDEWQRVEQAYREIQRRDSSAEQRGWRWERFALAILGLVLLQQGVMVWQWLDHRTVQAFVQVVVQDDKGTLLQVGIPQDLL